MLLIDKNSHLLMFSYFYKITFIKSQNYKNLYRLSILENINVGILMIYEFVTNS